MNQLAQLPTRLRAKIHIADDGCWLWTAGLLPNGYGLACWQGRQTTAHRVVWLALGNPTPEHLHHTCEHKRCVNPDHLEALDVSAHMKMNPLAVANRAKTHCPQGHSLADAYVRANGSRRCRTCGRNSARDYYARKGTRA